MKIFGMVLVAAILLGLAALLGLLIPHHLQIRGVDIVLPAQQDVLALRDLPGEQPVDVAFVTTAEQESELGRLGHVVMLVTWADGRQLAIDAGMNRQDAAAFGEPMESIYNAAPSLNYGPVEEQLAGDVNLISGIVFTHLHSDHTLGVTALCAVQSHPATIMQTSDQASLQNHLTEDGQTLVQSSACTTQVLSDALIKPLPGYPGVYAIAAGGHTPGSTIYVVNTRAQQYIFSGDITNAMANIEHNEGKGWIYSYLVVPEDTALLEEWREWLRALDEVEGALVLPAHDIEHMRSHGLRELTCAAVDC